MYDKIFKLIQNGELNKAQEQLENTPENDPKRYNISGLIYYQKKEFDKAKEEFEKGLKINPVDSDLLFNYGYLLKNINQEKEAWRYLMRIHNKDWATYDLLGDIEYKKRSKLASLRFYKKAAELPNSPNEMKKKFIDMRNIVKQDTKIAFLCLPGLDNFLKDIVETFSLGYDVKLVVTTDGNQIAESIKWADIVWLEWANEMTVFATNQVPEIQNKKVVCRLHSYEIFTQFPDKINWTNIDQLIFVGDHIKRILHELHPNLNINPDKEIIVYNGVDLDKFKFLVHKPGYNLSVLAHINYKKDPSAWIQIINKLKEIDNRYKLHVGGDFQDPRYKIYFDYIKKEMKLENNFILHGWINEVDKFLEDKDYTLSTSIHEGHPYNILESMARGIKPVILNYSGAKEQWPNELIYNTIDEAVEKITEQTYDSESYRRFIEDNYSLEKQIDNMEAILNICYSKKDASPKKSLKTDEQANNNKNTKQTTNEKRQTSSFSENNSINTKYEGIYIAVPVESNKYSLIACPVSTPVKKNKLVFCNLHGNGYGGNPKYIAEEIIAQGLNYDLVWLLRKDLLEKCHFPPSIRIVQYGTLEALYELVSAKIWINNVNGDFFYIPKRENQFYIQTWHGIPLKKIGADTYSDPKEYIKIAYKENRMIDCMISNSTYLTHKYKNALAYDGKIIEIGYPRNDVLVSFDKREKASKKVKKYYEIDNETKVLMYAPTFRDNVNMDIYNIDFHFLLKILENKFSSQWKILFRLHPKWAHLSNFLNYGDNVINVSDYEDANELMAACNALITDYSSVMFDFSIMKRPVFLYVPDLRNYKNERELYFDIDELPYDAAFNNDDLFSKINNFDQQVYEDKLISFFNRIGLCENGKASENVVEIIKKFVS